MDELMDAFERLDKAQEIYTIALIDEHDAKMKLEDTEFEIMRTTDPKEMGNNETHRKAYLAGITKIERDFYSRAVKTRMSSKGRYETTLREFEMWKVIAKLEVKGDE